MLAAKESERRRPAVSPRQTTGVVVEDPDNNEEWEEPDNSNTATFPVAVAACLQEAGKAGCYSERQLNLEFASIRVAVDIRSLCSVAIFCDRISHQHLSCCG